MESAFVDDSSLFWPQFCDSPLYFALLSRKTRRRVRIRLHPQPRSTVSVGHGWVAELRGVGREIETENFFAALRHGHGRRSNPC
jgi:hypothetical protein